MKTPIHSLLTGAAAALGLATSLICADVQAKEAAATSVRIDSIAINPQPLPPHDPQPEDLA